MCALASPGAGQIHPCDGASNHGQADGRPLQHQRLHCERMSLLPFVWSRWGVILRVAAQRVSFYRAAVENGIAEFPSSWLRLLVGEAARVGMFTAGGRVSRSAKIRKAMKNRNSSAAPAARRTTA